MPFTSSSFILINSAVYSCACARYGSSAQLAQSVSIIAPVSPSYCCPFSLPITSASSSGSSSAFFVTSSCCASSFSINSVTASFSFSSTLRYDYIAFSNGSDGFLSLSTRFVNSLKLTEISLSSCR